MKFNNFHAKRADLTSAPPAHCPLISELPFPPPEFFSEKSLFFLKKELEVSEKIVILQKLMILAREGSPKRD